MAGGGGAVGIVIALVLIFTGNADLLTGGDDDTRGGPSPSGDRLAEKCRTGADATDDRECLMVRGENSLHGFWDDQDFRGPGGPWSTRGRRSPVATSTTDAAGEPLIADVSEADVTMRWEPRPSVRTRSRRSPVAASIPRGGRTGPQRPAKHGCYAAWRPTRSRRATPSPWTTPTRSELHDLQEMRPTNHTTLRRCGRRLGGDHAVG